MKISVNPSQSKAFTVKLRIPGWTENPTVKINGEAIDIAKNSDKGYLAIKRTWAAGDTVTMDLPMPVRRIYAHPQVRMDVGRVALSRGPLVYCVEQHDNGDTPVTELRLPRDAVVTAEQARDLLGGITVLKAKGVALKEGDWNGDLYRAAPPTEQAATLTAIPYYIWNNRGPNRMQVWISERN